MTWSPTDRFDLACSAAVLIIGLVTCMAVRTRLRGATLPLAGLFVLAADSKLFWPSLWAFAAIEQLGYRDMLRNSSGALITWYLWWHLLPILLAGLCAWALWRSLRRTFPASG